MCHNDEEGGRSVCHNKVKAATSSTTMKEWPLYCPMTKRARALATVTAEPQHLPRRRQAKQHATAKLARVSGQR